MQHLVGNSLLLYDPGIGADTGKLQHGVSF